MIRSLALVILMTLAGNSFGQTPEAGASQTSATQSRVVGQVTAVDSAANQITIKSDSGEGITILISAASSLLRLPAGETSAQKAVKINLADITVGDRLFARVATAADKAVTASQIVVSSASVSAGVPEAGQRQARNRGLNGRITALNPDKKEISVQSRSREGVGTLTIQASDATRFFRYAPDSLDIKNASRSSFAGLKVGDQLRALGDANTDGTRFTAEEIISGLIGRTGGQVTAINAAANEITVKNNQTGQTVTVSVGSHSMLRRVSAEDAAAFDASRPARQDRPASATAATPERPTERRERPAGGEGRPRAGRGLQEILESLPAIKVSDLKKGDTVFVSGTQADPSHMTAIMLITGDPTFIGRFLETGPNRGPQNPGLPGDVLGGGVGNPERP
ncbi:MAG TPA: DUF5666 domain-containing protein [Pyrinomonadaceae bacterium]|nr:DUF5666 domain-containing protein [Pyrinomonadaceae bacterium]